MNPLQSISGTLISGVVLTVLIAILLKLIT